MNHWDKIERPGVFLVNGHVAYPAFAVFDVPKDQERGNENHGSKVIVLPFDRDLEALTNSERRTTN